MNFQSELGKKGVLRIDNKDEYCFKYAVCACLHPSSDTKNPCRHIQYEQFFPLYNWKGMSFPVGYRDIEIFEKNNPNIVIKSWKMENMNIHTNIKDALKIMKPFHFPSLTPQEIEGKKIVYLLFCFPSQEVINKRLEKGLYDIGHVCAIRDVSAFLRGWRSENMEVICDCCGNTFRSKNLRDEHIREGCYISTPRKSNSVRKILCFANIMYWEDFHFVWMEIPKHIWKEEMPMLMMNGTLRNTFHKQLNFIWYYQTHDMKNIFKNLIFHFTIQERGVRLFS